MKRTFLYLILVSLSGLGNFLFAEDGSRLWLRFSDVTVNEKLFSGVSGRTDALAVSEFNRAWNEITGSKLLVQKNIAENSLVFALAKDKIVRNMSLSTEMKKLGDEGFLIRKITYQNKKLTLVAANTDAGLLYGSYHLLRLLQTNTFSDQINVIEKPAYNLRILNHWDNLNGTVERGYAGRSIWKWDELPAKLSPRYEAYARANASVGINATVLNNVNATPDILTTEYIQKIKALASVFRPFNIKVFISINFASPKQLGNLPDADPMRPEVQKWWKEKVKEIYRAIPYFGGFLVKANSEGLPGPMDYGRTHVDGANMIADALKPYGGLLMWRAFVYEPGDDRAKLAYKEFIGFDGKFRDNVIIQVKNGPIDFQPREPFSPLFGAMKRTPVMPELQITQEYLGHSNHLVFLAPMWEEVLKSDTYAFGKGSTVAAVTDGTFVKAKTTAIAGVANIGEDINWTGHHFAQANWYAFGRQAWNHQITSKQIAEEWTSMTFNKPQQTNKSSIVNCQLSIVEILLSSHETCVNYMMPLGLHHIFAWEHHYGPEPWCDIPGARPDWLPKYYHNASKDGIGFDRTDKGSNAVSQYFPPLNEQFNNIETCPEKYLLWFQHVPWTHKMKNGRTLWDELCYRYDSGVQQVREYQKVWDKLESEIDSQRFAEVESRLRIQARDAVWWKDAILLYFQTYSQMPIPYEIERPVHELDELKKIKLDMKHHN
ncbi:MAG: alpha-glucuronidase family glycosyl hydrolase [Paludibacter sp.]|nr:alpha-glucuronidase family glycosyl hydrolase [Paludibacter sp.]